MATQPRVPLIVYYDDPTGARPRHAIFEAEAGTAHDTAKRIIKEGIIADAARINVGDDDNVVIVPRWCIRGVVIPRGEVQE